jgi:hypothetical protein
MPFLTSFSEIGGKHPAQVLPKKPLRQIQDERTSDWDRFERGETRESIRIPGHSATAAPSWCVICSKTGFSDK